MAFKIKDNLDLYGNQLLNFALQSDSGFPQSPQVGHMFNYTGTGVMANHAVMCVDETTKAFKALAFVDEIATNAEFVELKEKVDLLIGDDVDTDTIIDSWKEVQAFLAGIEDTKTLAGMLSSYLPKSGGTISGSKRDLLYLQTTDSLGAYIVFKNNNTNTAFIGYDKTAGAFFETQNEHLFLRNSNAYFKAGSTEYPLIHSGNIGEYALKMYPYDWSSEIKDANAVMQNQVINHNKWSNAPFNSTASLLDLSYSKDWRWQLFASSGNQSLYSRFRYSGTSWSDWKTIAFTDSTVAAAQKLVDNNGRSLFTTYAEPLAWSLGLTSYDAYIDAKTFAFRYGSSYTTAMLINSSGNVTIGDSDLYGIVNAKLHVDGRLGVKNIMLLHGTDTKEESGVFLMQYITSSGKKTLALTSRGADLGFKEDIFTADWNSGNVGIGGLPDTKAKLHVVGDLYVDGNIIATKEVSAGGAGQEGASGDGGAEVISQQLAKGQSSYTIPNTIGRSAVAVSLYEWNANNGSWDMCLADISVKDATITVTFGSATSVNHKLVAVG